MKSLFFELIRTEVVTYTKDKRIEYFDKRINCDIIGSVACSYTVFLILGILKLL